MQEQQLTRFYNKLLHYLNRTYATNIRTQELYLDLRKHTRKLRFNSIKNIYNTLTEGKADEVIFSKEKPYLMNSTSFDQKFTERTCWRIIEKLISKVAYYLMNEKKLNVIAPSILKALHFTRNATQRVTQKTAFVQYFSEVIDTLIAQNNLLEQKIYQLLIERGYIYSIDEFYRMSRFQGPDSDFVYSNLAQGQEKNHIQDHIQQIALPQIENIKTNERSSIVRSKKRMLSIRKFVHSTKEKAKLQSFTMKTEQQPLPKLEQHIQQAQSEAESDQSIDSQLQDDIKYNKLVHNIHNQVERVVDQIMNHKDFQAMLANSEKIEDNTLKVDEKLSSKQPILKQVLKNLKIKNFKANKKLLVISQNNETDEPQRKNSRPKEQKQLKLGNGKTLKNERNRNSIATAISSRLRQKVMNSSGIHQIKQLVVRNLQNKSQESQDSLKPHHRNTKRLQTQTFEINFQQSAAKLKRRSSNLHFLKNALIFNSDSKDAKPGVDYLKPESQRYADLLNQSSLSSENALTTLQTISSQLSKNKQNQLNSINASTYQNTLFMNEKIAKMSRFGYTNRCGQTIENKPFSKDRKNNFNVALLQLAAKKYHRCSTEQNKQKNLQEIIQTFQSQITTKNLKKLQDMQIKAFNKQNHHYMHHRRYQTYDRLQRRVF